MSWISFYLFSFLKFSFWNFPIPSILKFLTFSLVNVSPSHLILKKRVLLLFTSSVTHWFPMKKFFLSNHQVLKLTVCFGLESTDRQVIYFQIIQDILSLNYLKKKNWFQKAASSSISVLFSIFKRPAEFFTTIFHEVFIKIQVVEWQFLNNSKLLVAKIMFDSITIHTSYLYLAKKDWKQKH